MLHRRIVVSITAALLSLVVTGCAGPATETGVGGTDPTAASSSAAVLCGTWQGSFAHPGADYTSPRRTELALQVRGDSTYTLTWGTRPPSTGTIAARGNRVILNDSSGSQITLMHTGDTLYGLMKDSDNGRAAMMSLEKQASDAGRLAAASNRC